MHSSQQRNALRQQLRRQRRALDAKTQQAHALLVTRQLKNCSLYRRSKRIALYLAADGEIDTHYLIYTAWRAHKKIYLPVLTPFSSRLYFAPYTPGCKLKPNRFGIAEPDVHPKYWLKPQQLSLIFMPLVGFDPDGNRLGMGGGFYDRSLSFHGHRKRYHHPYLIGLAHQLQCVDALPVQPHDVPMHMVATEQQLYTMTP